MAGVPASERTRNELKAMFTGNRPADRSRLYDEAPVQPAEPWPDELLPGALGRSMDGEG